MVSWLTLLWDYSCSSATSWRSELCCLRLLAAFGWLSYSNTKQQLRARYTGTLLCSTKQKNSRGSVRHS